MSASEGIGRVRQEVLERIDRSERNYRLALFGAVVLEAVLLVTFLLAADFSDRTHLLLLIATAGGCCVIVLGLVTLGAHVDRAMLRVLKAIELLRT